MLRKKFFLLLKFYYFGLLFWEGTGLWIFEILQRMFYPTQKTQIWLWFALNWCTTLTEIAFCAPQLNHVKGAPPSTTSNTSSTSETVKKTKWRTLKNKRETMRLSRVIFKLWRALEKHSSILNIKVKLVLLSLCMI